MTYSCDATSRYVNYGANEYLQRINMYRYTNMFTLFDNKQNVKKTTRAWHKFCVKKYNNYLNCKNLTTDGSYGGVDEVFLNEEHGYLLRTNYKLPGVTH